MGHPGASGHQHVVAARRGFPLFYGPLAVAFFTLLFVPLTAGGRSMVDLSHGGELLLPVLQSVLVALLVMAVVRPSVGALPVAIAAVCAGWLSVFALDPRFSGVRVALVALMVGTLVLAAVHAWQNRAGK